MTAKPVLVLARREASDDRLARSAEEAGYDVVRLELFETRPGAQVDSLAKRLETPEPGTAVAWTSRRAAAVLATAALPFRRESLASLPLFAVGEESAAPIASAGLRVETPASGLGASHLAGYLIEHAAALRIKRVLFLHGDKALPDFPGALTRAGIAVERFEVYRTSYLAADPAPMVRALEQRAPLAMAYYSPSAIAGLERLLDPAASGALHEDAIALARGETTYQALLRWGYAHAARPVGERFASFDAFVLDALQSVSRNPQ
jgi:uroporphyrinogen-III synthase